MVGESSQSAESVFIPVASEQQAMDWSLVLTSQGITSTILRSADEREWVLAISVLDRDRALAAIRQYQWENREWRWRDLPWQGGLFHWGALGWCLTMILFYAADAYENGALSLHGMVDGAACRAGQWCRLFTAVTLHADVGHLASNVTIGLVLLGLAMARYGAGWGLLAAYLAGVAGNLTSLLVYPVTHRGLGASGMVMGALGLLAVYSLAYWQYYESRRLFPTRFLTGVMLFILLGLNPQADVVAHLGGFIAGGLLGVLMIPWPVKWRQSNLLNWLTIILLAGLVIYTWYRCLISTLH
jgi:rhomboid protease GluP